MPEEKDKDNNGFPEPDEDLNQPVHYNRPIGEFRKTHAEFETEDEEVVAEEVVEEVEDELVVLEEDEEED
ncbi:MAG: hypothetical protein ACTSRJ_07200 [Candidatus Hodarchaeales archaeon]